MRKLSTHLVLVLYAVAASGLPIAAHLSHVDSDAGHSHACTVHHEADDSSHSKSDPTSNPQHDDESCAICFAYTVLKQAVDVDVPIALVTQIPPPIGEPVRSSTTPTCTPIAVHAPRAPPALG